MRKYNIQNINLIVLTYSKYNIIILIVLTYRKYNIISLTVLTCSKYNIIILIILTYSKYNIISFIVLTYSKYNIIIIIVLTVIKLRHIRLRYFPVYYLDKLFGYFRIAPTGSLVSSSIHFKLNIYHIPFKQGR